MENKQSQIQLIKKVDTKQNIKKNTHLYYHDKFLNNIPNLNGYESLQSLYLHSNNIRSIENLDSLHNLTSLYLHKNKIRKIENINELKKLKRLHLDHNEISVLENLDDIGGLEELYIEKQNLQQGESLCFDPRTILKLSVSLQVLNISHNGISSIAYLEPLKYLKVFNASHNKIQDINDIKNTIKNWYYLYDATFVGNPVAKMHRYRENLIGCTIRLVNTDYGLSFVWCFSEHLVYAQCFLETLDNKAINEMTRCFIKRLEHEKQQKTCKTTVNLADKNPGLPKNYPHPLQKAVSASIIQKGLHAMQINEDDPNIYVPWNALPKSNTQIRNAPPLLRNKSAYRKTGNSRKMVGTFPNF